MVQESGLYHLWEVTWNGEIILSYKSFNANINYIIPSSNAILQASSFYSGSFSIENRLAQTIDVYSLNPRNQVLEKQDSLR